MIQYLATAAIVGLIFAGPVRGEDLEKSFTHPPDAARPWVYWFWKNGNISRDGITADLEAMERVGIGGVILMEVALSMPPGPVTFFSEPWRKLFKHAVAEADRLGLKISMNSAPGWTGSGGPWVKPEQSMQKVVASETVISGPKRFAGILPQPETQHGFYRDIAVLAFPTPEEHYLIADIEKKALYKRGPISSQSSVRPAFPAISDYEILRSEQMVASNRIVDLTSKIDAAGRLTWEVPQGSWTVLRFGRTSTGQTNHPAPLLGLECDKLDTDMLDAHFQQFTAQLLADVGHLAGKTVVATHLDSWEVGAQNWTRRFREEFQNRRGYDLMPYLPVMTGRVVDSLELSERFLWDLRQTVSELIVENHGRHLQRLAHQHGLWLSIEPYDMTPCDDMTLGATADVPMCEFWSNKFDTRYSVKEATSVAHVYGKPIVAAEAFTSVDRWLFHPASIKALGDWAFCEGVNRFVIHRYVHQPWPHVRPGLSLGQHGLHYERTQTWWELSRPWHEYLARCQYLLQQGRFVADVLYLSPEGAPNVFQGANIVLPGYKFDACTPEALLTRVDVADGRLVLPDGMSYRLLVLPRADTMTPALLRRIHQLVEAGATLIGTPPRKSPSLSGYPQCDLQVQQLVESLWGAGEAPKELTERTVGQGRVLWSEALIRPQSDRKMVEPPSKSSPALDATIYPPSETVVTLLDSMGVLSDFETEGPLRYAHRQVGAMDVFFVSNAAESAIATDCTFRVMGKQPELWHPETGRVRPLSHYSCTPDGRTVVPLRLMPSESYFVVFRQPAKSDATNTSSHDNFPETKSVLEIEGPWQVSFDPRWGGPEKPILFETLEDWTQRPEEGIRYYSGTAYYRRTIDIPADLIERDRPLYLDLGRVEVMAEVKLNGKNAGILWKKPFQADITNAARAGANTLEVKVVNLWPNRMIGDAHKPADSLRSAHGVLSDWPQWLLEGQPSPTGRYTFATWHHWGKDSPLITSGLLGPVRLLR